MPRRKTVHYDGIAEPYRRGARWVYRVWDPQEQEYRKRSFVPEAADISRLAKGTAAGDRWAIEQRALAQLGTSITAKSQELPTAAVLGRYIEHLTSLRRRPAHVAEVRRVLSRFAEEVPDLRAGAIQGQVRRWRAGLQILAKDGKGVRRRKVVVELAPSTLNRYLVLASALIRFAIDEGLLTSNPVGRALEAVDEPDVVKPIFTVPELRAILALQRRDDPVWRWVVLMAYTGCRSEEAAHLRARDINREARVVEVRRQLGVYDLKREKERNIPLQAGLLAEIDQWGIREGFLAYWPQVHDRKRRVVLFGALLAEARLKPPGKGGAEAEGAPVPIAGRSPHSLRHGYAAMMLATREDVFRICRAMGHADLRLTEHYSREVDLVQGVVTAEVWKPGELRLFNEGLSRGRERAS